MKVKKSEIQLLIAVLGVLLVVVTYFLVYAKFNELSDAMESQNMSLRSQVSTLEVLEQRKADYLADTEKMKTYITGFENRFPADILPEDSIMMVKNMEDATRTYVANISFGTIGEVAYDAQASADTQPGEAPEMIITYAETHMYEVPLGISIECTYDDFKGLVRYIYNQQERESIQGVNISYNGDDGKLSGNMNLNTYYLLGTDKVYGEPYIPDMPMGVQTIFGNVN